MWSTTTSSRKFKSHRFFFLFPLVCKSMSSITNFKQWEMLNDHIIRVLESEGWSTSRWHTKRNHSLWKQRLFIARQTSCLFTVRTCLLFFSFLFFMCDKWKRFNLALARSERPMMTMTILSTKQEKTWFVEDWTRFQVWICYFLKICHYKISSPTHPRGEEKKISMDKGRLKN